jgi:perosamine synthetase
VLDGEKWSATEGSWVNTLEKEFAGRFNARYAVAMNSGTSTLHAALVAAGVGPGDEVLSPGITVIMNSTATIHANAIPVYVDVDPKTFSMDPVDLERKITRRAKAIIPVAIYGLPCDMDEILRIAQRFNLKVIEDNAQCFLSTYKGRLTGTIGDMASYSFENSKHISCGEGGMVITNNESYAEMVRKVGGHGFKNLKAQEGRVKLNQDVFQNPHYKRHDEIGWNYRMPEFNAAVALAQLERLNHLVEMRVTVAGLFIETMKNCDYLVPQVVPNGYTHSYWSLAVSYEGQESIGVSWADFRKAYIDEGGDGFYGAWSVPYLEPVMAERKFASRCPWVYENVRYETGICPVAESVQPKIMQFKTNYRSLDLAKSKVEALGRTIKRFSQKRVA